MGTVVLVDQMGGVSSSLMMRLKSVLSVWIPRAPRSFQISTVTSSGPGAFARFIFSEGFSNLLACDRRSRSWNRAGALDRWVRELGVADVPEVFAPPVQDFPGIAEQLPASTSDVSHLANVQAGSVSRGRQAVDLFCTFGRLTVVVELVEVHCFCLGHCRFSRRFFVLVQFIVVIVL